MAASSLLKSAEATRKRIREQQDALVAYEWQKSAKTYEDYLAYSKYLTDQSNKTGNQSDLLSYQKAMDSARSGYISNEVQRQTIDVIEGRSTSTEKYNRMVDLYYMAANNGAYDLAQSLVLQLDNLSVKIQNEAESAQRAASAMAMNQVKSLDELVKKIEKGNDFVELPDGTIVKTFAMLNSEVTANGQTEADYFGELYRTAAAISNVIADAYEGATTQEAVDRIASKYQGTLEGTKEFATAAGRLNIKDIELAYRSSLANNPIYSVEVTRDKNTGQTAYKLTKNKIEDFVWIRNDDGTYSATEVYTKRNDPYQRLDAQITNDGNIIGGKAGDKTGNILAGEQTVERNDAFSIRNRLANMGYSAEQNADGTIKLIAPDGQVFTGAIMPDGTVRYFGAPGQYSGGQAGMYQIDLLHGGVKEVNPEDVSVFGSQSQFGGLLSKPSEEGKRLINNLTGITKPITSLITPLAQITSVENDFTGRGVPVFGSATQGSSAVLQSGQARRDQIQQQNVLQPAKVQAAQNIQHAYVPNLNQTPTGNGVNRDIQVARPTPTPNISVSNKPVSTPNISTKPVGGQQKTLTVQKPQSTPNIIVR